MARFQRRAAVVATALVVAVFLSTPVDGKSLLQWQGSTTNFFDDANWQGASPMSETKPPAQTVFPAGSQIESLVKGGTTAKINANVGKRLYLPSRLILTHKVSLTLNTPSADADDAVFVGGETTQDNDLACHKNYVEMTAPSPDDSIIFAQQTSYHLWSSRLLDIEDIRFGITRFESCSELDPLTFAVDCDVTYLEDDESVCSGTSSEVDVAACLGHSSCPTPQMAIDQNNAARDYLAELAKEEEEMRTQEVVKQFAGTFTPGVLGVTAADLSLILWNDEQRAKLMDLLRQVLADRWGVDKNKISVSTLAMTSDGLRLEIQGTVAISLGTLVQPGQDPQQVLDDDDLLLFGDIDENSQVDELVRIIQEGIQSVIADEYKEQSELLIDEAKSLCGTLCDDLDGLVDQVVNYFKDPEAAVNAMLACPSSDASCIENAVMSADMTKTGQAASDDDIQSLIGTLSALDLTDPAISDFLERIAGAAAAKNIADDVSDALPTLRVFSSSPVVTGTQRPSGDLFLMVSDTNRDALEQALTAGLEGNVGIISVPTLEVSLIVSQPTAARRRDTEGVAAEGLEVNFDFSTWCAPSADCSILSATPRYASVQEIINSIVAGFEVEAHVPCYVIEEASFDDDCLEDKAEEAFNNAIESGSTPEEARSLAKQAISDILECGSKGRDPVTSECYELNPQAEKMSDDLAADVYAAYSTGQEPGDDDPEDSESSTDATVIIAAAAAGGVVVLIIVIVLVLVFVFGVGRSEAGGSSAASKGVTADRNVVAFENPMYEEGKDGGEGMYDAPTVPPDDTEGLYDEPAFVTADKSNPVYSSTENIEQALADEAAEDEGGYLDVGEEADDE